MYANWPSTALKHWTTEQGGGADHVLVFRGPRLKMGVSRGVPTSITPDHLGRAEYRGAALDRAAELAAAGECGRGGGAYYVPDTCMPPSSGDGVHGQAAVSNSLCCGNFPLRSFDCCFRCQTSTLLFPLPSFWRANRL